FGAGGTLRLGEEEGEPAAHGRADDDLRPARAGKDRLRLLQPARNGAVEEIAAGEAVAGIVEARHGETVRLGMAIERLRLGSLHVGAEAAEPEQTGGAARTHARGNFARRRAFADRQPDDLRL